MPANVVSGVSRVSEWHRLNKISPNGEPMSFKYALTESGISTLHARKAKIAQVVDWVDPVTGEISEKIIPITRWTVVYDGNSLKMGEDGVLTANHLHVGLATQKLEQFG